MIIRSNQVPVHPINVCTSDMHPVISVQGVSLPSLRDMILGAPGSYVNLTFLREKGGEGFHYDIDLIRGDPNQA